MTIWAYYRVSSDEQTCESQKVGVVDYAKKHGITINKEVADDDLSGIYAQMVCNRDESACLLTCMPDLEKDDDATMRY